MILCFVHNYLANRLQTFMVQKFTIYSSTSVYANYICLCMSTYIIYLHMGSHGYNEHYLDVLGNECPEDKYLNKFVRDKICAACANNPDLWRDLGIELMGQKSADKLDAMKVDYGNVTERCSAMFVLWRQTQPKANWNQLIRVLKDVKLVTLANEIDKMLLPCVEQQLTDNQPKMEQHDEGIITVNRYNKIAHSYCVFIHSPIIISYINLLLLVIAASVIAIIVNMTDHIWQTILFIENFHCIVFNNELLAIVKHSWLSNPQRFSLECFPIASYIASTLHLLHY